MKVSSYISKKISTLSFVGIIFVVYIHSTLLNIEHYKWFVYTQDFLRSIWNSFYPMFFAISGYFFFIGIKGTRLDFIYKYKSRFKSLIIPYFFWNISFLMIMLTLKYNPVTASVINSDFSNLFSLSIFGWFHELFVKPFGFHLWFIRDLICIVFFAPLIWFLIKKIGYYFIFILIIAHIAFTDIIAIGSLIPFVVGATLAIRKNNIEKKISGFTLILLGLLTILIGFITVKFGVIEVLQFYVAWIPFLFIWFGYDFLINKKVKIIPIDRCLPYTFFIYVFHEPYLNIFKKIFIKMGNSNECSVWVSYFISPIITVVLAIVLAKFLERITPGMYKVINGGRAK